MKTYEACAKRWKHGWELHIDRREHNTRIRQEKRDAAAASRKLARQLRADLSGADTAAVLGVSKGRVSQLSP